MAQFDESKVISPLHIEKAEVGKKYWVSDQLVDLKEEVEKEKTPYELKKVKKGYLYPFATDITDYQFLYPYEKPPKKYRPYKDTEEMINDFCERSGAKRSKMGEPFIWVKYRESRTLILDFGKDTVWTTNCCWTMQELFESYTYCDGSPIGKKE